MENIYFNMTAKVFFERKSIEKNLNLISAYGKKALIVSGKNFARNSGLLFKIRDILDGCGVESVMYSEVNPEPDIANVERGAEICRKNNCDCVIGLGGGSPMDVAKAIAVISVNKGPLGNYFGEREYENPPLPVAVIPTTCGTGSEVTRFAVIMDRKEETKKTVSSELIIPKLAILDADTIDSLPGSLVAGTGMDAFAHSAESFLSARSDNISRMFAKESIGMLCNVFNEHKGAGFSPESREIVFYASLLAGFAINRTGTIIVHGMGYSLTVDRGIHHGTANALLLPYVFEYLKDKGYETEFNQLEAIWGATSNLSEMVSRLGLPSKLSEAGFTENDLDRLADLSVKGTMRSVRNMKTPLGREEFRHILEKAL